MLRVYSEERMIEEIKDAVKTVMIVGNAGTGKTKVLIKAAEQMGVKLIMKKLAGTPDTDITGVPFKDGESNSLKYLKLPWIKYIIDHPEEEIILGLDKICPTI